MDLIKSLSYQLFVNIAGFYQGFQQLKESNNTDLEELCEVYLVNPLSSANGLIFHNEKGRLIGVLKDLNSFQVASALRSVMDRFPPSFGLIITSQNEQVCKVLNDLLPNKNNKLTKQISFNSTQSILHYNVCLIYVPNEGDDV